MKSLTLLIPIIFLSSCSFSMDINTNSENGVKTKATEQNSAPTNISRKINF